MDSLEIDNENKKSHHMVSNLLTDFKVNSLGERMEYKDRNTLIKEKFNLYHGKGKRKKKKKK